LMYSQFHSFLSMSASIYGIYLRRCFNCIIIPPNPLKDLLNFVDIDKEPVDQLGRRAILAINDLLGVLGARLGPAPYMGMPCTLDAAYDVLLGLLRIAQRALCCRRLNEIPTR
jgi:hypothetical protein